MEIITNNLGTIFVVAVLLLAVILIIKKLIRDKKNGVACINCENQTCCSKCSTK